MAYTIIDEINTKFLNREMSFSSVTLEYMTENLTNTQLKTVLKILKYIKKDNILYVGNTPCNIQQLANEFNEKYDTFRKIFNTLENNEIIKKYYPNDYNGYLYVFNPWITTKNTKLPINILNLFDNSVWKEIQNSDKNSRNSYEYALWEYNVAKRDGCRCAICGSEYEIEIHHIKPYSDYPDLRTEISNGITLCKKHHNSKIKGSFHNTYGTVNNNKAQLQEYCNNIRTKIGLESKII